MKLDSSFLQIRMLQLRFTRLARAKCESRKSAALLFSVVLLLAISTEGARGQSALDGFDPNANGVIRVVVVQPDGKTLLGGDFTSLAPNGGVSVTRNRIARLNRDGTLDTAFNPNANSPVYAIAVQTDGKILAGGLFASIGGQPRNRMARLDATTGLADSFNPNADGDVYALAVQADGEILAGGFFANIGGQPRSRIARLHATTGLADSFNPSADTFVVAIVIQTDGKILAAGGFQLIGGQFRNYIARLDPITGAADSFDPNSNSSVSAIALQADGKVLVGGSFAGPNSIGGQTRNAIARLNPSTGLADSFDPNANGNVLTIAVQPDGKILLGGFFTSIGGQVRNRVARIAPADAVADSFNPNFGPASLPASVFAIALQTDGKVLVGGSFTTVTPNGGPSGTRNNIARLETDGRLDQTLDVSILPNYVSVTAVQPNGKIIVGGLFNTVLGVPRQNIARLNTDGTLDAAFNPTANGLVWTIALQADGKILVGGEFDGANSIGGQTRSHIARLDPVTGAADSFNPNANQVVFSIAVQTDGKILVGGQFSGANSIGGETRNRLARLDPNSGLADSFNPNPNGSLLNSIAVEADGKILAGGEFTTIGGQARNRIARLHPDTGLAEPFNPNANAPVYSFVVQADGKIIVTGAFGSIGGQTRNFMARLDASTGLADTFNPNPNNLTYSIALQTDGQVVVGGPFNGPNSIGGQTRNFVVRLDATTGAADSFNPIANGLVRAVALLPDGKILAGGEFSTIGGQTRSRFARLNNDTSAQQSLTVTQTTATWMRGGSNPQFTRVTFEDSIDGVNYNFLGAGTSAGSTWSLTGLNLAIGQNLYIRARGHYRGGYRNNSDNITESVRNVFLVVGPTPTPTPTATPALVSISGTVAYCSNPALPPVSGVTMSLTGPAPNSTPTNGSGVYTFSGLTSGGSHTVTPSKAALAAGSAGISTVDVLAVQRHFLSITPIPAGCRLVAADVNGDANVTTVDVLAVQRFFLGLPAGTANVGKYNFSPTSRSYPVLVSNQPGQNYDTLIFGDVTSPFVN